MSAPKDPEKRRLWIERISASKKGKPLSDKCKEALRKAMTPEVYKRQADAKRGHPLSEEHKRKIAEANRGRQFSEGHLRHLRETVRSDSYRRKMSKVQTGIKRGPYKKQSPESIAKRAAALRGLKRTPEQRQQMSERAKKLGIKPSPLAIQRSIESRKTHPSPLIGRQIPPDVRAKISATNKGKKRSPESIAKFSETMMGHTVSVETRRKLSKANSRPRKPLSPQHRENQSLSHKRRWEQLPEEQKRRKIEQMRSPDWKYANGSKLERLIGEALADLAIEAHHHYKIGTYEADFFIPQWNLVVECDGRYWHSLPEVQARDSVRDAFMRDRGYTVLRLGEKDIRANPSKTLIRGLRSVGIRALGKGA